MKDLTKIGFVKNTKPFSMTKACAMSNPKYITGFDEYTNNCQRCVIAYELLRRGYAVTAKQALPIYDALKYTSIWENVLTYKSHWHYELDKEDFLETIHSKTIKNGRYAIIIQYHEEGTGHAFIIEKSHGRIYGIDPQTNERGILDRYIDCADSKKPIYIYRLDNAEFNSKLIEKYVRSATPSRN